MTIATFIDGDAVRVAKTNKMYLNITGQSGSIVRWLHDDWYLVKINNTTYVVHATELEEN